MARIPPERSNFFVRSNYRIGVESKPKQSVAEKQSLAARALFDLVEQAIRGIEQGSKSRPRYAIMGFSCRVQRWRSFRGLIRAACFSAAALPRRTSRRWQPRCHTRLAKPLQRRSSPPPQHSLDGLEAEVIDSQEQSRDDADSNSALVLT